MLNIIYNKDIGAFVNETTPDVVAPQFEMLEWAAQNPETTMPYNPQLVNELLTVIKHLIVLSSKKVLNQSIIEDRIVKWLK